MKLLGIIIFFYLLGPSLAGAFSLEAFKYISPLLLAIGFINFFLGRRAKLFIPKIWNVNQIFILIAYTGVILYSYLRTNAEDASFVGFMNIAFNKVMFLVIVHGFVAKHFAEVSSKADFNDRLKRLMEVLFFGVGFVVLFAVGSYYLGFKNVHDEALTSEDLTPGVFASLLGINLGRSGFIVGGHPNGFGVFVAILLVFSIIILREGNLNRWKKVYAYATLIASVFVILVVDSRATVGVIFFVLGIYYSFSKLKLEKIIYVIFWAIPIASISISVILKFVAETEVAQSISRSDNEFATGNSRSFIWNGCLEELSEFDEQHLLGYGQQGHVPSGAAQRYAKYLGRITYTHSFIFQSLFDSGYIGFGLMLGVMFLSLHNGIRLHRRGFNYVFIFVVFPISFSLSGIFEAPYGEYNSLCTNFFNCLVFFSIFIYNAYLNSRFRGTLDK